MSSEKPVDIERARSESVRSGKRNAVDESRRRPSQRESGGLEKLAVASKEAAAMLGISERTLWALTSPRGPIPSVRIGARSVRYSVAGLKRFLDEQ